MRVKFLILKPTVSCLILTNKGNVELHPIDKVYLNNNNR